MLEIIAIAIFLISTAAAATLLYRKIPALVKLPQNGTTGIRNHELIARVEKKIKDAHFNLFEKQVLLQKILSWAKVYALKFEAKIDSLLHQVRKNSQQVGKKSKDRTKSSS